MRITHAFIVFSLAALVARPVFGQVENFGTRKIQDFTQLSAAQPALPGSAFIQMDLRTTNSGDAGSVDVALPGGASSVSLGNDPNWVFADFFPSVPLLDAAYPSGMYSFQTFGGSLGSQSALSAQPSSAFFPPTPFFTGTSWNDLQGPNPNIDLLLTFNSFLGQLNVSYTDIDIFIPSVSNVFHQSLAAPSTGVLIPGGTLVPNTFYQISITFVDRTDIANAGFGGASSYGGFLSRTNASFTTIPEPATLLLFALGGLAAKRRHR